MVVKNMKKLFVLAVASATLVGCGVSNSSLFNETATGIIEHYYCDICKQRYSDEECTNNITNITIDKVGHVYSEWTYDDENHTKRCTRDGCKETLTYKHELKLSYIDGKYYIQCKTYPYSKM